MSTTIHSRWEFLVKSGDHLFAFGDKLMLALLTQEECRSEFTDVAVAADSDRGVIEVEANATGDDMSDAIAIVRACVRAAMHEVGIGTPDWPTHDEVLSMLLKDFRTEELV